ncbi:MAG: ABC transporter ATP-binding protein [Acidimicrobiales bacterium]
MPPLLELKEATVRFGGHVAVDEVSLAVEPGTVTGLIGPNGAGKTTLFNVITGLQATNSGRVRFDDQDITTQRAHRRARHGIARTFQRLEVFGSMTTRENILVGAELRRGWGRHQLRTASSVALLALCGVVERGASTEAVAAVSPAAEAEALMEFVGVKEVADVRADELPTGLARLVELGRALAVRPRLLLLDEPASGQDESETGAFADLLTQLAEASLAILLVEHDVPLVMRVCSRVYVLDFGRILATGTPAEIQADQTVLDAYLGAEPVTHDPTTVLGTQAR